MPPTSCHICGKKFRDGDRIIPIVEYVVSAYSAFTAQAKEFACVSHLAP